MLGSTLKYALATYFLIFYREAETVDPRRGHPVPQGIARRALPASGGKDVDGGGGGGGNRKVNKGE